jgi:hypothetical protein
MSFMFPPKEGGSVGVSLLRWDSRRGVKSRVRKLTIEGSIFFDPKESGEIGEDQENPKKIFFPI